MDLDNISVDGLEHAINQAHLFGIELLLGVKDFVRIERREKDFQKYVVIQSRRGQHVRGLDGFDYNISVDGLEHAINNPTALKSAFIWNRIALTLIALREL